MTSIGVIYLIKDLLLPPSGNLLLLGVAWLCRRKAQLSRTLVRVAIGTLFLCTLPFVSALIAQPLERTPAFNPAQRLDDVDALVILGGGVYNHGPEWRGRDTVNQRTLERIRYAAYLAQKTDLPIAVSGGSVMGGGMSEGLLIAQVLGDSFHLPVAWLETKSRNTAENALYTRQLLPGKKIVLVTQSIHMPRARRMFEQAGFEVIPAPCGFSVGTAIDWSDPFLYLPSADALSQAREALHEYVGIVWYHLRYRELLSED